jgi:hypothetical protein
MAMSNFISESERHEALYSRLEQRHREVLTVFNRIKNSTSYEIQIDNALKENNISNDEIEWLKRLGYYLPQAS